MSFFQNPVGNRPRDPYEDYKVDAIEKDKEERERFESLSFKNRALSARLLFYFRKLLSFFEDTKEKGITSLDEKELRDHLHLLKIILETLKKEDRSQDPLFIQHLSELWSRLTEDSFRFKNQTPLCIQFKALLKEIQEHPKGEEHSLGYYLAAQAGQSWIPFPFMEMLHKLYSQHQKNPTDNPLENWTKQTSALIISFTNVD